MLKIAQDDKLGYSSKILRLGLVFVLIYAAISQFKDPGLWVGFIPDFVADIVNTETVLKIVSITHLLLAFWLLWGKWIKFAGLTAFVMFLGVVLFNFDSMIVVFRDVALAAASLALTVISDE